MSSTKDQIGERIGRARAVSIRLMVDFEMAEILIQYVACIRVSAAEKFHFRPGQL
jgi:hypothetical protein